MHRVNVPMLTLLLSQEELSERNTIMQFANLLTSKGLAGATAGWSQGGEHAASYT